MKESNDPKKYKLTDQFHMNNKPEDEEMLPNEHIRKHQIIDAFMKYVK